MTFEEMKIQLRMQGLKKGDRVLIILDDFTTINGVLAAKDIIFDTFRARPAGIRLPQSWFAVCCSIP